MPGKEEKERAISATTERTEERERREERVRTTGVFIVERGERIFLIIVFFLVGEHFE